MKQYLTLLDTIMSKGVDRKDRTGTGTRSVFGHQMRFDLSKGFPLLTTKKLHLKSIIHELIWFLSGDTNIKYLKEHGVKIWDAWASPEGELGPVYGSQWRQFGAELGVWPVDQISILIEGLKRDPEGRRHIVTAWNPLSLTHQALPPCHMMFQCYVANGKLSLHMYQRSVDVFLGLPFNIASYALLTMMLAQVCDLDVGELVWTGGDTHLYHNHFEQVKEQRDRCPGPLPTMTLNPEVKNIFDFRYEDFTLTGYEPDPHIPAPVAV